MDRQVRKQTLRLFSNGIYILTSRLDECYGGATVTWVSQASFKPPLIMAAVRPESNAYRCLVGSGFAAIHVLTTSQVDLAQRFFAPTAVEAGCMNGEPFRLGKTSVPILESPPAYVECRLRQVLDGMGDHATVILEVVEAESRGPVHPLTVAGSPWEYSG